MEDEETEEESDDARRKGSKCSFKRSNSSESGAESSNFWSWAVGGQIKILEKGKCEWLTSQTSRFLECYAHLGRVPSAVVAVQEERWFADGAYGD